jgi:poly(hydroxyalkanoate) depolymerase family esterase
MIHGCQTTAYQQMQANLYNPLADRNGFVVLYPDVNGLETAQPGPTRNCWQFPNPSDWQRDQNDMAALSGMTRTVMVRWYSNRMRVYAMGMSAGAFMTSDLAATYPDIYAAVGQNAGGAYADGTCLGTDAASLPVGVSAQMAFAQMGPRARIVPKFVIGGDHDQGIPPACADKSLLQILRTDNLFLSGTQTAPIKLVPASVAHRQKPHGRSYTVATYRDQHGCVIGQRYLVHGMNHFWSGGSADKRWKDFTDATGPSAAVISWRFFSRYTLRNTARPCRTKRR